MMVLRYIFKFITSFIMNRKVGDSQRLVQNINESTIEIFDRPKDTNQFEKDIQGKAIKANVPDTNNKYFMDKQVPIYRMEGKMDRLVVQLWGKESSDYFAYGELIGKFYQSNNIQYLPNTAFIGQFEGLFEWANSSQQISEVFFQGTIHNMQLITKPTQRQPEEGKLLVEDQSSFHGYFKGHFFPCSIVGGKSNIFHNRFQFIDIKKIPQNFQKVKDKNCNKQAQIQSSSINSKTQYFLPTLVRFEVLNVGDINLQKSRAVINGNLHLQVKYNEQIESIINENKLSISLTFNRDISLSLPLYEEEDESQDSQWSIQQKTWDIEFYKDEQHTTFKYKILKRFKTEIDNSYGAFFAPFNLSKLTIVVTVSPIYLGNHIKLNFTCVDTQQFKENGPYNPLAAFNQLGDKDSDQLNNQQINRYYKINRHFCNDTGEYLIADNHLTIYPHFKNILQNTGKTNEDWLWNLGVKSCMPLFQPPLAKNLFTAFNQLKDIKQKNLQINEHRFFTFNFLKWNNAVIEVSTFKYIVIDMIKVFVPLTIISIISLFIFEQENGIGQDSKFSTLAYRIVNIASLVIVFVSMIPIIRSSLPKMPSITLIEIITYLQIIPSFFAVINSMQFYSIPKKEWRNNFYVFEDTLFFLAFCLSIINLLVLITMLIVYKTMNYRCKWKIDHLDESLIRWKSPLYIKFMESVKTHKKGYYDITELQS